MKRFLGVLCCIGYAWLYFINQGVLYAERLIYVVPHGYYEVEPWNSANNNVAPYRSLSYVELLRKEVQARGCKLIVSDLSEFDTEEGRRRIQKADTFIFFDIPVWMGPKWEDRLKQLRGKKLMLYAFEPPVVIPHMYSKEALSYFQVVFTWKDSLVDNKKFLKICYPVAHSMTQNLVPFSEKRFLTMISGGGKESSCPNELYSERIRVIQYFEKVKGPSGFEFYGTGWGNYGFKNYKGQVVNKLDVLRHYRFSICYENMKNVPGYITEKIFDCFEAGCVPIYWGADNIERYIPKDCYILRENFSSFEKLVYYLNSMNEEEYNGYIRNIRNFLNSDQAKRFTDRCFVDTILPHLFSDSAKPKSIKK